MFSAAAAWDGVLYLGDTVRILNKACTARKGNLLGELTLQSVALFTCEHHHRHHHHHEYVVVVNLYRALPICRWLGHMYYSAYLCPLLKVDSLCHRVPHGPATISHSLTPASALAQSICRSPNASPTSNPHHRIDYAVGGLTVFRATPPRRGLSKHVSTGGHTRRVLLLRPGRANQHTKGWPRSGPQTA